MVISEENLISSIEWYTSTCVKAVKNGDRNKAITSRDKVISLLEIKQKEYSLNNEEKGTLRTIKHLAKYQNNKRLKTKLLNKINK